MGCCDLHELDALLADHAAAINVHVPHGEAGAEVGQAMICDVSAVHKHQSVQLWQGCQ